MNHSWRNQNWLPFWPPAMLVKSSYSHPHWPTIKIEQIQVRTSFFTLSIQLRVKYEQNLTCWRSTLYACVLHMSYRLYLDHDGCYTLGVIVYLTVLHRTQFTIFNARQQQQQLQIGLQIYCQVLGEMRRYPQALIVMFW